MGMRFIRSWGWLEVGWGRVGALCSVERYMSLFGALLSSCI